MLPKFLNAEEVAESLGISRSNAYAKMRRGEIPSVHSGKSVRVLQEDYFNYLESIHTCNSETQLNTKSAAPTTDLDPDRVNPNLPKESSHE
jgi:excisionase family DNA binding protein